MLQQGYSFTSDLIDWFSKAKRDLPWRKTNNPYHIWLSEIILQQTRVEQGLPYYYRFIETHPDVHSLAQCEEKEVLKLWEGLGYYSRARNLHTTARFVSQELKGVFPDSYKELLKLKGVGPYTAAAIASIAFKEPVPVVDGNVFRFISRYFGLDHDIAQSATRKFFEEFLLEFISKEQPGDFNQAMMEYGATICTPSPTCHSCKIKDGCYAYEHKQQAKLPVKSKKVKVKEEKLEYLVFHYKGSYLMHARKSGIWTGLYQFYLKGNDEQNDFIEKIKFDIPDVTFQIKHQLTHRRLLVSFTQLDIANEDDFRVLSEYLDMGVFTKEEILNLPKPKVIVNYLQR